MIGAAWPCSPPVEIFMVRSKGMRAVGLTACMNLDGLLTCSKSFSSTLAAEGHAGQLDLLGEGDLLGRG